mgnify:CR=1 FL=1
MQDIFGPDGLIAQAHPEYEHRPGQSEMARAVVRAFENRRHLIVEAGTGTGKTLAYLVPAVAAALGGRGRVIISTGTKNLQEQLMEKDIPFLQSVLPKSFKAAYMKGRNNYACLHRLGRAESSPVLEGLEEVDYFDEVVHWAKSLGHRRSRGVVKPARVAFLLAPHRRAFGNLSGPEMSSTSTPASSRACASVPWMPTSLVVNHHLFFADLALAQQHVRQRVLPDYSAVILDEAAHDRRCRPRSISVLKVSNYQIGRSDPRRGRGSLRGCRSRS